MATLSLSLLCLLFLVNLPMKLQPSSSSYDHSFHICFSFAAIFSLTTVAMAIYLHKLKRRWCNCKICHGYLTSSWTEEFQNLCDWYSHLLQKSPTKTIHIHILNNVITANPENVEYMLKTKFDNYPKGKQFSVILGDLLGLGIFNVDGELWRFQRKMASLVLDSLSVRSYTFEVVAEEINRRLVPLLSSVAGKVDRVLDLQDVFRRFSFDMICRFSFGLDPECLNLPISISEFAVSFDLASKLSAERAMNVSPSVWKIKRALNIGSEKVLRRSIKNINLLAKEVIRQRREIGFSDKKDLLSRFMLKVRDENLLRDIIVSFILAGRDTVAAALTGFFFLVGNHPIVEAAILDEADRVIGPTRKPTGFEQLRELHYLQAALYESMRLFPPVQLDSKFCQDDDVLPDGSVIKKGTRVTYHPYAMGRMEEIWGPDCLEYKPERWLKDGVFNQENSFKYPIFHGGFRICLGKDIALIEITSIILSVFQKYRVELVRTHQTKAPLFSPGLTATFRNLLIMVHNRD